ncbi:MAG: peptide chain release factor N(5)-glutamine methyltransferase [Crocinitomicaceae bacterium]
MFVSSNRLSDIKSYYQSKLAFLFSENEINLMVKYLTIKRLEIIDVEYINSSNSLLSESDLLYFNFALKRLLKNEPFQHIIGNVEFYGLELNCDARALIPRPETEELVDWVFESFDKNSFIEIADLCAGSGCIALALKSKLPNSEIIAAELSKDAIALIEENCIKTNLLVIPMKMDVLIDEGYTDFEANSFDCWVSNPPYIPHKDKEMMSENVLDFEPHMALFVEDNDPLIFYIKLAENARKYLKNNGLLFFEIHEDYSQEMLAMLKQKGFVNIELRKDLQGKARMMRAQNVILSNESE